MVTNSIKIFLIIHIKKKILKKKIPSQLRKLVLGEVNSLLRTDNSTQF